MGFSRQEYWNGLPGPPPGHLPNSGTEPASLALAGDSLPLRLQGSPICRHCATGREHHRFWFGGAPGTRPLRGACTAVSLSVPLPVLHSFFHPHPTHLPLFTLWEALTSVSLSFEVSWFVSSLSDFSPSHRPIPGTQP